MSHRTQITLTDEQYARLRDESARTGLGLAELVRRAVDRSYGSTLHDTIIGGLDASFGAWADHDGDGGSAKAGSTPTSVDDHGKRRCAPGQPSPGVSFREWSRHSGSTPSL